MVDLSNQRLHNRPTGGDGRATFWEVARWSLLGAIFVGMVIVYSANFLEIRRIQYEMGQLRDSNTQLEAEFDTVRAEYKSLTSARTIAEQARQIGLIGWDQKGVQVIQAEPEQGLARGLRAEIRPSETALRE